MKTFPVSRHVNANGIRLAVFEQGSGPPVVLLHGFPELAWSWRHQLPALARAGYRAIAPDLRGYGASDKPASIADYSIEQLSGDVTGLLDALELPRAMIVGHDWGALLAWHLALTVPERMVGLVALNVPFIPQPPADPIRLMRERFGPEFYIVHFQDSDEADRRFSEDVSRFLDRLMRRNQVTREQYDSLPPVQRVISLVRILDRPAPSGDPLLDEEELAVYTAAFSAGGFTGPINWYRNWSANWRRTRQLEQFVRVPSLFIGATDDIVISLQQVEAMRPKVSDLEVHMLDDCGHWTQQERPAEVNALLLHWFARRYPAA